MALLDQFSCECLKSELDLFSVPPTQTSIEQTTYKSFFPINAVTGNGPLEFHFTSSDEEYLDLQQSFLSLRCSIRSATGTPLPPPGPADDQGDVPAPADETYVYPINYFISTQFKSVDVFLSGTQVSANDNLYSYRSFIETFLTFSDDVKNGPLQTSLYYQDKNDPHIHDKTVANTDCTNQGAHKRFTRSRYSKTFDMIGKIHSPIFAQPKLLLNKMDVRLKFNRHDPKFSLMSFKEDQTYSVQIEQAKLYIAHKKIADSVRESHELGLLKSNAKYPVRVSEMKFFTKAAGHADLSEPNLVTGLLPRRVVIGLVRSSGFNGSNHLNPLAFECFDLESIQLRKNGVPLPFDELDLSYSNGLINFGYISMFQGTGRLFLNHGLGVDLDEYVKDGTCLYVFDISQDGHDGNLSLLQEGTLSLQIKLREGATESITILVYLEREGLIEIDKDRNVTME